ncbi:MAG: acid phosphatase [Rudaea sp.]
MHTQALSLALLATLASGAAGPDAALAASTSATPLTDISQVKTIVVIYAENRAFDHLYGKFPGANGLAGASAAQALQLDRNGQPLATLPPINGNGLTDASDPTQVSTEMTRGHSNAPYALDDPHGYNVGFGYKLHDLVHRFYNNQMQINGGKNNLFAAYSDAGGEVMGNFDGTQMALWSIAQQYTLADNFFQGAFGGSFLNHQYLICACAPYDFKTAADPVTFASAISAVNADGVSLKIDPASPASALDGVPKFVNDAQLTPDFYGVNTMQPPYQPSSNKPAAGQDPRFADLSKPNTLSPQGAMNIGDLLTQANVGWAWYAGAWQAIQDGTAPAAVTFQYHHQPFNYFADLAPGTAARAKHLLDGGLYGANFIADIDAGKLPPVTFYKPQGSQNQHPGYATVNDGDLHIANVIAHLQNSPQWANMVVLITYDENGGWWDHVAPPKGDRWGPGSRIPAIIVSPFAKRGYVDHTQYDSASALRLITRRFNLPVLPGLQQRDNALIANGGKPMGDLTAALDVPTTVDAGFTGYWYNPAQSGHGFNFEILPGNQFVVSWYTFNNAGQQAWLAGAGTISNGVATVALDEPIGGLFPPYFTPAGVTRLGWGTLKVAFSDCAHANASWTTSVANFGTGSGSIDLVHLTQPVSSASCH